MGAAWNDGYGRGIGDALPVRPPAARDTEPGYNRGRGLVAPKENIRPSRDEAGASAPIGGSVACLQEVRPGCPIICDALSEDDDDISLLLRPD